MIGILLLLLGILIGLMIDKTTILSNIRIPYLSATPTPTPLVTPTPPPDPTANWKTYTNTQYNYSLKHPVEWEEIIDPKTKGREFTLKLPNGEFIHGTVFIGVPDSNNDNNYRKTFNLANNTYVLITYVACDGPGCGFGKANLPIFTQILSTFRFTGQPTVTPITTDTCPPSGYVDCMPGTTAKPECSLAAMAWYKANCPDFKGGAL